jgi:hypothetical protein
MQEYCENDRLERIQFLLKLASQQSESLKLQWKYAFESKRRKYCLAWTYKYPRYRFETLKFEQFQHSLTIKLVNEFLATVIAFESPASAVHQQSIEK